MTKAELLPAKDGGDLSGWLSALNQGVARASRQLSLSGYLNKSKKKLKTSTRGKLTSATRRWFVWSGGAELVYYEKEGGEKKGSIPLIGSVFDETDGMLLIRCPNGVAYTLTTVVLSRMDQLASSAGAVHSATLWYTVLKDFFEHLDWPSFEIGREMSPHLNAAFTLLEKNVTVKGLFRVAANANAVSSICSKWKMGLVSVRWKCCSLSCLF
jgi:hypothetical protein